MAVDRKFLNEFKLIELVLILSQQYIRSTAKKEPMDFGSWSKVLIMVSTDYETFDQLKKHNFDQVNFGQTTPCLSDHDDCVLTFKKKDSVSIIFSFPLQIELTRFVL